jgi:DNA-binding NarL/FixJ family response regulator
MIGIVLIEDHVLVRTGLRLIIDKQPDMRVVGEAGDGEPGLALVKRVKPRIAIVDLHMPGLNGIEVVQRIRRTKLDTRVIVLTMMGEAPFPYRLLEAGANGYLTKGCPADDLLEALREVDGGRKYLSADVARQLALNQVNGNAASPFVGLSARELEVAMMLSQGLTAMQIGERLRLSAKTISTYKYRMFDKLAISNVVTLAHLLTRHGLMPSQCSV